MARKKADPVVKDKHNKYVLQHRAGFDPKWLPILQNLSALRLKASDIGMILGHTGDANSFIANMKKNNPEAKDAIDNGRRMANIEVVAQAFRAACGYEYEEEHKRYDAKGDLVETKRFTKWQKGEPNLLMFLLCNRMGDEFKSVHKIEVDRKSVSVEANVEVTGKQIQELGGKLMELANARKKVESEVIDAEPRIS